jgi:putative tryptophan/tyrosine transport system substrate-binding protein
VKRREFLGLLAGAAAWPVAGRAQQPDRVRRIGVLMAIAADDPEAQVRLTTFRAHLETLGWTAGRNVQIETRFRGGDPDTMLKSARELVALAPDVILAYATPALASLLQLTRTIPIVFVIVADPVGGGFVDSLVASMRDSDGFCTRQDARAKAIRPVGAV